ncbi:MAG: hypothetical protein ACI8T1_000458, partial [Verrucomicrobiales bacterium]
MNVAFEDETVGFHFKPWCLLFATQCLAAVLKAVPDELLEIGWLVSGSAVTRSRTNTNQKPSMNHIEIIQQLGQDDRKEVSTIFDA